MLKRGSRNEKKMLNCAKGLISQRRREKKMTFPLVFISSTLEVLARKKKRLRRISHRALKITLTPFS